LKPDIIRVAIDHNETLDVFWGVFEIPGISGYLECSMEGQKRGNMEGQRRGPTYFKLGGEVKRKNLPEVQKIAERTREIIAERSIYRGKAFRLPVEKNGVVNMQPHTDFLDPYGVNADELIFSDTLQKMIDANLFAPVRHTALCQKHGVPLKRGILLEGPFGTGKTLCAAVMAQVCYENNWTFISIDKVSGLAGALEIAKLYEPAVVFAEDIDRSLSGERSEEIDGILNTIDGVTGKSAKIITVLTTNEVQNINQAMLRPGRLDAVISIQAPDAEAAEKLLRVYGRGLIADDEDLSKAGDVVAGQIPAVIREVVERSKLHSISRGDEVIQVRADDIVTATAEMEHHLELLNRREPEAVSIGDQFLEEVARRAVGDGTATAKSVAEIKANVQKVLDCVE
jgi:transitional endoplasmic reticulum ATPase